MWDGILNIFKDVEWDFYINNTVNIIKDIIIALVVWKIGKILLKLVVKGIKKSKIDSTVSKFVISAINAVLYLIVGLIILNTFGVDTGSLVTILSAIGVSLSLALKDTITPIAQGVFLLAASPFKVGQEIEAEAIKGIVIKISLFYTELAVKDEEGEDKAILIPNDKISKMIIKKTID